MIPYVASFELDGSWCPMAHGSPLDDSFHDLPPMRSVHELQAIPEPPEAYISLGAFTGEEFAVGVFHGAAHPALVAFDYDSGAVRWSSPFEDLPVVRYGRQVSGILMAKMSVRGEQPRRCVFAANPIEFVAYDETGARLWKQPVATLLPEARDGIGKPRSLSLTPDHALVVATSGGWIIKLAPNDGRCIDAYQMRTSVPINRRLVRGFLHTTLSSVNVGNVLYMVVNFQPDGGDSLPEDATPVFLIRIDLDHRDARHPGSQIGPLVEPKEPSDAPPDRILIAASSLQTYAGSPVGMVGADGNPLIMACAPARLDGGIFPTILAIEDRDGKLTLRWRCLLTAAPGEVVVAAPGLYAPAGVYIVPTNKALHVFRAVHELSGAVQPAAGYSATELLTPDIRAHAAVANLTSPISVTVDRDADELVAYANVCIQEHPNGPRYGIMTAFALQLSSQGTVRPLWSEPLARLSSGEPAPGAGTFGQPSLFRYRNGPTMATGMIINTWAQGTVVLR